MIQKEEAYCSHNVSNLLKEDGFDWPTQFVWYDHLPEENTFYKEKAGKEAMDYFYYTDTSENNCCYQNSQEKPSYIEGDICSAPTQQMAMRYLRKKGIYIIVSPFLMESEDKVTWWVQIIAEENFEEITELPSFEEAVDAAIEWALKNIK